VLLAFYSDLKLNAGHRRIPLRAHSRILQIKIRAPFTLLNIMNVD
jgi:hypothetical protein